MMVMPVIITQNEALMNMVRVVSSAIAAIGYDEPTQRMTILFRSGRTYSFCRVPASVHQRLMASGSKGRFYNDHIKDRYRC